MKTIKYLVAAFVGLLLAACSQDQPVDSAFYDLTKGNEQEVLINYAANTLLSMYVAEIAAQNAGSEKVREFASSIAKDHREIYGELEKLAAGRNIRLPQMFMEKQAEVLKRMRAREGASADKAFVNIVAVYDRSFGKEMEQVMRGKAADEGMLEFARLVDAQRAAHQNKANMLKPQISA